MKKDTLKKVMILAFAICTILTIYACGGEEDVTLKLGEKTTVGEYVEFTPTNVLVSKQVFPPVTSSYPMGWTADSGKTYAAIVAEVKNLGDEEIKGSDLCSFKLTVGEETFNSNMTAILSDDNMKLSSSSGIKAGKTAIVYFITQIDEKAVNEETLAEFAFLKDDDEPVYNHKLTIDTTRPVAVVEKLDINKKITVDGLCELTPTAFKFASKIEPSNPGYYYNYYKAQKTGDKLSVLTIKTKNLSKAEKEAYSFYGITVFYKDAAYIGGVVADDENKANITQYEKIPANATRTTYGVGNLPKAAENAKCDIYVYVDGTYYQYTYEK